MSGPLNQLLARRGAVAMRTPRGDVTYRDMSCEVDQTIKTLRHAGVSAENRIFFRPSQDRESVITLLALLELESCVVVGNSRWPLSMIEAMKKKARVSWSVVVGEDRRLTVTRDSDIDTRGDKVVRGASIVVPTSGSTGEPKLALLTLDRFITSARGAIDLCPLAVEDCWYLSLPLFHVGGLGIVFRSLLAGSSIGIPSSLQSIILADATSVTHLSLVPTQLHRLMRDRRGVESLRRQKAVLLGGAPIGSHLCREALSQGIALMPTYGLTEMASLVTLEREPHSNASGQVSVGTAVPGREVSISEEGEILVRGQTLFAGYLDEAGITPGVDNQGWFHTRDLGSRGPRGELFITGRADSQFISGGENIHPEMIEIALASIAPIVAACVVPTPDEEFGARPVAFVVCDGGELNQIEVQERLRSSLPGYAIPVEIRVAPQEMVSSSGKIQRHIALASQSLFQKP